jgi:hypothetical protein
MIRVTDGFSLTSLRSTFVNEPGSVNTAAT